MRCPACDVNAMTKAPDTYEHCAACGISGVWVHYRFYRWNGRYLEDKPLSPFDETTRERMMNDEHFAAEVEREYELGAKEMTTASEGGG